MKFLGYRRPDGRVGTRNHVLIMATVGCAAETARLAAEGLHGAVTFINQNGCGESSRNLRRTRDVLVGWPHTRTYTAWWPSAWAVR